MTPKNLKKDLALLCLLSTLWGASYAFIKMGVETIPPLTLIAGRTLIAGAILLLWMRLRRIEMPKSLTVWKQCFLQSILNSVMPFTLIAWAEQYVDAGLATILNSTTPVFAFLATWLITRHETVTRRKLFGVCVGIFGIILTIGLNAFDNLGQALLPQLAIVLATLFYAGAAIYGKTFKGLSPVVPAAGSLIAGAIILLPLSLIFDRPWTLQPSLESVSALLALSVFSTALAFVVYFNLIQTLGSVGTTSQAFLRVPIGVGIGILFLNETMTITLWAGLICVVIGVAAMTIPARARPL